MDAVDSPNGSSGGGNACSFAGAQVAECSSLERKLKDSVRQGEALQRNLLTVMDKELSMHKR